MMVRLPPAFSSRIGIGTLPPPGGRPKVGTRPGGGGGTCTGAGSKVIFGRTHLPSVPVMGSIAVTSSAVKDFLVLRLLLIASMAAFRSSSLTTLATKEEDPLRETKCARAFAPSSIEMRTQPRAAVSERLLLRASLLTTKAALLSLSKVGRGGYIVRGREVGLQGRD